MKQLLLNGKLTSASSRTRGHPFKLYEGFSSSTHATFFSERLINRWNRLPDSVNFTSLPCFKRSLDTVDFSLLS